MHAINPERFCVGTQFRHSEGGCWELIRVHGDTIVLKPMGDTQLKPRRMLLGRKFKVFGVWFKVHDADSHTITLIQRRDHAPSTPV